MKILISLFIKITYIFRAIKKSGWPYLGEIVLINGKEFVINNGVKWHKKECILYDCLNIHTREKIEAVRSQMKRKPNAKLMAIIYLYKFYMKNWYYIDLYKRSTVSSRIVQ